MKSYSQVGQDLWALENVKESRTYLDVGASQAIFHNNTYLLDLKGWEGQCFDKDEEHREEHERMRTSEFFVCDGLSYDWGTHFEGFATKSLGYLSLDCDEDSTGVMERILGYVRFEAITVEHDAYLHGNKYRGEQRRFLRDRGYVLSHMDVKCEHGGFEDWWLTRPELVR